MFGKVFGWLTLFSLVAGTHSALAEVPEDFLETPLATAFGEPPTIGNPMLAPDGSRLLFMQQNPLGISMLMAVGFEDGAVNVVLEPIEEGYEILWCRLANESRVLCDLRQVGPPNRTPDYHRYVTVNADGTDLRELPPRLGCQWHDQLRDEPLVEWGPDDPSRILFLCPWIEPKLVDVESGRVTETRGTGEFGGVRTHRVAQLEWEQILDTPPGPGELGRGQFLFSNGHGVANLYRGRQDNVDRWFVRDSPRDGWQQFLEVDPLALESPFRPVGYGADLDRVFNIAWDAEAQAWGLYRQDLTGAEGERENERVFARPGVDVELVDTMGPHRRVVAAAFLEGRPRRAIVDPRIAEVYEYLAAELPALEIEIVDESRDRNVYLVRTRAPRRAGELVLVDMENGTIDPIVPEYAQLADVELAETVLVEFEASSEGTITGNLTLPPGADGPVPAVILPRSQTRHENLADPHYLVQFLAANGYAVFRVNNRVEAEYGQGWLPERAVIGWNRSAEDIRDAAGFLIENEIAAPDRICGAGKDYGAYIALMSAIAYPELFQCVVSIGGVTNARETPGGIVVVARGERSFLNEASPLRRVEDLEAPALLFHGYGDTEVSATEHSLRFAAEAESAGKDVTLIEYPYANQEIRQRNYRIDMLTRIRGFLAGHIGPVLTAEERESGTARWRPGPEPE